MMRVMIVTNSLTGGGAERSMNLVCNELTKRGWAISLVPINSSPADQVTPICEVFPLERPWRGSFVHTIYAMQKFNKIIRLWKPDAIVLNCDLPELFGATQIRNHNLVLLEHASNPWASRASLGKIVRRILTLRKVNLVAVSSHLTIWPSGRKPSAVLQNPVTSRAQMKHYALDPVIKRLVFIGRLSAEKRPDIPLEVCRQTGVELVVIGDGLMRAELEKIALRQSIRVSFRGRIDNPWSEIRPGDLLIVPSAFEGDGLVVIEGLQQGIPMLLSDTPDFRRFGFPDRNYGKDVGDFTSKLNTFRDDLPSLLIPHEIANRILSSRTIEAIGDSWEGFLRQFRLR